MFHDLGDFFVIGVDHMFPNAVKVIDQFAGNRRAEKQKVFRVADIDTGTCDSIFFRQKIQRCRF